MISRVRQFLSAARRAGGIVPATAVFTGRLIREHKAIRRTTLFWAMWLITHVTLKVYQNLPLITTPVVAAYTVTVGILATVIAFYMQGRNQQDKETPK